jgi:hypothetical protein
VSQYTSEKSDEDFGGKTDVPQFIGWVNKKRVKKIITKDALFKIV